MIVLDESFSPRCGIDSEITLERIRVLAFHPRVRQADPGRAPRGWYERGASPLRAGSRYLLFRRWRSQSLVPEAAAIEPDGLLSPSRLSPDFLRTSPSPNADGLLYIGAYYGRAIVQCGGFVVFTSLDFNDCTEGES